MRSIGMRGLIALLISLTVAISSVSLMFDGSDVRGDTTLAERGVNASEGLATMPFSTIISSPDPAGIINAITESGVPAQFAYLPNMLATDLGSKGVNQLYSSSPAPMGITEYGFMEPSGMVIPYVYNTTSFRGTVMLESIEPFYLMNSNPGSVALQLSAVLDGVTVNGNGGHVYWIKNVALYDPSAGTVQLIANIWDFSTPSLQMEQGSAISGNGHVLPGVFYYYAGPVIQIAGESTILLFVNALNINGNNAVQFQYYIATSEVKDSTPGITYDTVVFDSGLAAGSSAPPASFEINGFKKTPSGFLYDAELAMTGPGMGSTTTVADVNGQMTLKFLSAGGDYTKLPAAYNCGSNTGETVQGLSVWWSSQMKPMAHLSSGPSLPVSMWGSQVSHSGAVNLQGTVNPSNAFVFVSMGSTFDSSNAAWAPVPANGSYKFSMPGRITYTIMVAASNHDPATTTIATQTDETSEEGTGQPHGGAGGEGEDETAAWANFTLPVNFSRGIYTPLYANGNDQLELISWTTYASSPSVLSAPVTQQYVVSNNQYSRISSLFARTNGFLYPEFSGIFIENTDANVLVESPPNLQTQYPVSEFRLLDSLHLPTMNNLNMVFYNTSHITVSDAARVTGWFPSTITGTPVGSMMFIDSSRFLVSSSSFSSMGSSLTVYGSSISGLSGTIWGNHFTADQLSGSSYSANMIGGSSPSAISLYASGNLIYNNYFGKGVGVNSPIKDPFNGEVMLYHNQWNLPEKASLSHSGQVNGKMLSGSIVETNYQGGNYWEYRTSGIPVTSEGGIVIGGDYYPLEPATYDVTFHLNGVAEGTQWSITADGTSTYSSSGSAISLKMLNGTHSYHVGLPPVYSADLRGDVFSVNGADLDIGIYASSVTYPVAFTENGLPEGTQWTLDLGFTEASSSGSTITVMMQNGSYDYQVSSSDRTFFADHGTGTILVAGTGSARSIDFAKGLHMVTFSLKGYSEGSQWKITVSGVEYSSSSPLISVPEPDGVYQYAIALPEGYTSTPATGSILVIGSDLNIPVTMSATTYRVTFHNDGMTTGSEWGVEMNGQNLNSTGSDIVFEVQEGNYSYKIAGTDGYFTSPGEGYVVVSNSDEVVSIHFEPVSDNLKTLILVLMGGLGGIAAGMGVSIIFMKRK